MYKNDVHLLNVKSRFMLLMYTGKLDFSRLIALSLWCRKVSKSLSMPSSIRHGRRLTSWLPATDTGNIV